MPEAAPAAVRGKPASLKNEDALTMTQTFQAMRNHNDRRTRRRSQQSFDQYVLTFNIDSAGRFIEHEQMWPAQHCAGKAKTLLR